MRFSRSSHTRYGIVCLFTGSGERDEAAAYFEQAVRAGFRNRSWIEMGPDLDPIRDHPRHQAALATLEDETPADPSS